MVNSVKISQLKLILLYLPVIFLVTSCKIYQDPEFRSIENLSIQKFSKDEIILTADAVLYNPNRVSITLNEIDINISVNDIDVNHFKQTKSSKINGRKEFKLPIEISFPTKKIFDNLLSTLAIIQNKRELKVTYEGQVSFKAAGFNFKVPVDYDGTIDFK
ncbi:LEA type 2 family protein [Chondrinema litorale]|uniref:LEA type 2 family protein n=1 Tax=Chondrinema litorale TaxID=2994555 RepID=UPI00254302F0|nr:LEA type 2 family protein [Chondrinema litorale]UZR94729.1 LEA type 2 family protein [Chondrinema litorale]